MNPRPSFPRTSLRFRERVIAFPRRPLVMAIVNVNDDSFSGDGTLDPAETLVHMERVLREGADIIDLGAESARTNRGPISEVDEIERLRPVMEGFWKLVESMGAVAPFDNEQLWPPMLSVNTWRSAVAKAALGLGADLLNDIGALPDPTNAALCAEHGAALLIMHSVGEPKVPNRGRRYESVVETVNEFFSEKIKLADKAGLSPERILLDPGIDFAKDCDDNLRLYREFDELHQHGRPLLLPVSRKTVIGDVLKIENPADRDAGTIACISAGLLRGAQVFRVHEVLDAVRSVKVLWGIYGPSAGR